MNQPPLEEGQLQLTSQHRVEFDKLNITLTKIYQKRGGRGKSAELINEWGYGNPTYYSSVESLLNRLKSKEFMEELSNTDTEKVNSIIQAIEQASERVIAKLEEVKEHVKDKIVIDLGEGSKKASTKKVKGIEVSLEG